MNPYFHNELVTLYHADALAFLPTLADNSVDMIMTDPPYGHNNNNGDLINRREAALGKSTADEKAVARPIMNDGDEAEVIYHFMLTQAKRFLRRDASCCCCCCGGGPDPMFARWSLLMDRYLTFQQQVIWDKGPIGMGWRYRRSTECVLVGSKGKMPWFDESHKIENIIRPGMYGIKKIIPSKDDHPTPKPVALFELFIRLHTNSKALVVDPFCGGGTTGVACMNLKRHCILVEKDERYCEMTAKRLSAREKELQKSIETAATAQHRCKGRCRPLQNARKSLERQGDAKCAERF